MMLKGLCTQINIDMSTQVLSDLYLNSLKQIEGKVAEENRSLPRMRRYRPSVSHLNR
jgi:hypothetical protein